MAGLFQSLKSMISGPKTYSFVVAKSFKGFKKFPMEVNLDVEAKENNEKFKNTKTAGMTLIFKDVAQDRIDVYLSDLKIGFISNPKGITELRNDKISDFGLKFEEDHVFDADTSEVRFRAHLFANYK